MVISIYPKVYKINDNLYGGSFELIEWSGDKAVITEYNIKERFSSEIDAKKATKYNALKAVEGDYGGGVLVNFAETRSNKDI